MLVVAWDAELDRYALVTEDGARTDVDASRFHYWWCLPEEQEEYTRKGWAVLFGEDVWRPEQ